MRPKIGKIINARSCKKGEAFMISKIVFLKFNWSKRETYTNFGFTYNIPKIISLSCLWGNRILMARSILYPTNLWWWWIARSINIYQLERSYKCCRANLTKTKSSFYRPEFISDPELWQTISYRNRCDGKQ